jgi:hypothetical protein
MKGKGKEERREGKRKMKTGKGEEEKKEEGR